jgi:hypothetical protein
MDNAASMQHALEFLNLPPDAIVTTEEVANFLRVTPHWLNEQRLRGKGPTALKLGWHTVRYRVGDVIAFLREQSQKREAA